MVGWTVNSKTGSHVWEAWEGQGPSSSPRLRRRSSQCLTCEHADPQCIPRTHVRKTVSYILSIGEVGTQGSLSLLDSQPGLMVNPRSMKNCLKTEGRYYVRNDSFWESCPLTSAHTLQNRYPLTHVQLHTKHSATHTHNTHRGMCRPSHRENSSWTKKYLRKETWSHNCMAKLPRESLWCGEEIDILWLLLVN